MAVERTGAKEQEQSQFGEKKKKDERDEEREGNAQIAYAQAEQQRALQKKETEADQARGAVAKTEQQVAQLEGRFEALGGNREDLAKKSGAQEAQETPKADQDKARQEAKQQQQDKRNAEAKEAAEAKQTQAAQQRDQTKTELVQAYKSHKQQIEGLMDILRQLAALELDPRKRNRINREIEDLLTPQIEEIDKKLANA